MSRLPAHLHLQWQWAALLLCPLLATAAHAATLSGRVINGTTGEPGHADRIALFDLTQPSDQPLVAVDDVDATFSLDGIPDAAPAHFRLVITADGVDLRQPVTSFDTPMDVLVYESTDVASDIVLLRHHVIFTRDAEHMQVTEFLEYDNRTSPARTIRAKARAMRVQLDHDMHGEPTASLMGSALPVDVQLEPTDEATVRAIDYPLQPGPTRVVVRYRLHEEDLSLDWSTRTLYPTEERRVLVSPDDIEVVAPDMIPTESSIDGYAAWAGLPATVDTEWLVSLHGGSTVQASAEEEEHAQDTGSAASGFKDVVPRPNALTGVRYLIMGGLGLAVLLLTLLALRRGTAGPRGVPTASRLAVSKMADRYVSGEITREEYEREAARLADSPAAGRSDLR